MTTGYMVMLDRFLCAFSKNPSLHVMNISTLDLVCKTIDASIRMSMMVLFEFCYKLPMLQYV